MQKLFPEILNFTDFLSLLSDKPLKKIVEKIAIYCINVTSKQWILILGDLMLIMEYCPFGCLRKYLKTNQMRFVNRIDRYTQMRNSCDGRQRDQTDQTDARAKENAAFQQGGQEWAFPTWRFFRVSSGHSQLNERFSSGQSVGSGTRCGGDPSDRRSQQRTPEGLCRLSLRTPCFSESDHRICWALYIDNNSFV